MTDNVENIILEHLRAIRSDVGNIRADVAEIKLRLGSIEMSVGIFTPASRFCTAAQTAWMPELSE